MLKISAYLTEMQNSHRPKHPTATTPRTTKI